MDVNTFYKCKIIEILIEQGLWPPDDMCVDAAYLQRIVQHHHHGHAMATTIMTMATVNILTETFSSLFSLPIKSNDDVGRRRMRLLTFSTSTLSLIEIPLKMLLRKRATI